MMQAQISYCRIEPPRAHDYLFSVSLNLNIRELRKAKGMTLAELASIVGVSIPHLSEVERGKKNLNNHLIERLAAALNVPPHTLIAPEDRGIYAELFDKVPRLSPENQLLVSSFVDTLIAREAND